MSDYGKCFGCDECEEHEMPEGCGKWSCKGCYPEEDA